MSEEATFSLSPIIRYLVSPSPLQASSRPPVVATLALTPGRTVTSIVFGMGEKP